MRRFSVSSCETRKGLIKGAVARSYSQGGIENQKRLAHRIHDVLGVGFDGLQVRFRASTLRDVFHRQHKEFGVAARTQLATIEQHHSLSDDWEGVRQLKVVEDRAGGNDVFEQCPQGGNVPLAVAQLVNETVLGFFGRNLKSLIEGAIRGADAQGGVEHQERFAHRVHDVLGVRFDVLNKRFLLHGDVLEGSGFRRINA